MAIIRDDIIKNCMPGDILLTCNSAGIGKLINFGQGIEDGNRKSKYGHVAIFAMEPTSHYHIVDGTVFESVKRISQNPIANYHGQDICVMRHVGMNVGKYFKGREEILDNIGQVYPAHRLVFHGLDMINAWFKRKVFRRKAPLKFRYMRLMPLDWPVCSELAAQFIHTAGLKGGWEERKQGWRGVNPDDFDDARTETKLWETILEGGYDARAKNKSTDK
jgi:hypothetical protein